MRFENVTGVSGNYVQCFDCKNAPILPTRGDLTVDIQVRLQSTAEHHEQRHKGHDVVVYVKTESSLPIVRGSGSTGNTD